MTLCTRFKAFFGSSSGNLEDKMNEWIKGFDDSQTFIIQDIRFQTTANPSVDLFCVLITFSVNLDLKKMREMDK